MVGMRRLMTLSAGLFALSILSVSGAVHAQSSAPEPQADDTGPDSATPLAKKLQNPDSDLYSFPFRNNTNFNSGPHKGTQDILNVRPVIPIHVTEDWNVITRTILPLIWQPSPQPVRTVPFGTGPTTSVSAPPGRRPTANRCLDRAGWRSSCRCREDRRQAASQLRSRNVLQRGASGTRRDLAGPLAGHLHLLIASRSDCLP